MIPTEIEHYDLIQGFFDIIQMPDGRYQARVAFDVDEGEWLEADGTLSGARKAILDHLVVTSV